MSIKNQLQDVYDRIMAVKYPDNKKELRNLLQHELLPIVEENELLKKEFDRRILYYERLKDDKSYLDLIASIHKEIEVLQMLIDPSKLPDSPRLFKPKHDDPEEEPWVEMSELHESLNKEDTWWRLGNVTIHQVDDHVRTPWRPVVRQYQIVMGLIENAYKAEAIDMEKADEHISKLQKHIGDLERRLERPFVRLHIHDFDFLNHYMHNPDWMGHDEKNVDSVKKYVDRVCKDLLLFLDEQEEKHKQLVVLESWKKDEKTKRKQLQKDYEEMMNKIDLQELEKRYKNNPAVEAAVKRITSPEFLKQVGESIKYQESLKKSFEDSMGHQLKVLSEQLDSSGFKRMQEQAQEANEQFKKALEHAMPSIEAFERQRETLAENAQAVTAALNAAMPSMVEYGKMMSEQNELIQNASRNLLTSNSPISISPSVPVLPSDAVIITREEYLEYERLKARYRTDQARTDEDQDVQDWQGDQEIEYNYSDRLLTVGGTTVEIPRSERSVNRQVLLQLLADDYLEEEDGMGITAALLTEKLNGLGVKTNDRTLQTAVEGMNEEVKVSLGLMRFVRQRSGTAYIYKKR